MPDIKVTVTPVVPVPPPVRVTVEMDLRDAQALSAMYQGLGGPNRDNDLTITFYDHQWKYGNSGAFRDTLRRIGRTVGEAIR